MKKFNDWFNTKFGWFFTNGNKMQESQGEPMYEALDTIEKVLLEARNQGLEKEVMAWSLKYMKEYPHLTISEAVTMGYFEWIK
jgi:hypothetical protein